jgi:hypothetical protein
MSRKACVLTLAVGGVCGFAVSSASAQLLPGNVWPNSEMVNPAPAGPDPVEMLWGPSASDSNPRPDGWHRGGSDWGVQTVPQYCLWDQNLDGGGGYTLNPSSSPDGEALEINDTSTNGYGEWFSDYNPLPADCQLTGAPFELQFSWEYTNVASTMRPESSDQFRVSVYWGVLGANLSAGGQLDGGIHTDELITAGSPDVTTWTTVDEMLTPPLDAQSMEITIDSGGSSQATGQIWVDQVSVATVPEPASIAGIISGSMLLLARRRRRA